MSGGNRHSGRGYMVLDKQYQSPAPEALLRDFAAATLGRKRCSADYIAALRVVLANMARADRLRGRLKFSVETSFASIQVMRGQIEALHEAKLLDMTKSSDGKGRRYLNYIYTGRRDGPVDARLDRYSQLQRLQDDHDFYNYLRALGLTTADCPY